MRESPTNPAAVRVLADRLEADDSETRADATTALESIANDHPEHVAWATEAIRARLDDDDSRVRAGACRLVGKLGIDGTRMKLRELRLDPSIDVSEAAKESLSRLEDAEPVEPIPPPTESDDGFDPVVAIETSETPATPGSSVLSGPWPAIDHDPRATNYAPEATVPRTEPLMQQGFSGDGMIESLLIDNENTVYISDTEGIHALNISDEQRGGFSSIAWSVSTSEYRREPVAVAGGIVYTDGEVLGAINATDGSERWHYRRKDLGTATATVHDETMYATSAAGTLLALSTDDGAERWRVDLESGHVMRPTVTEDAVHVAVRDDHHDETAIVSLSADDGNERWRVDRKGLPKRPVVFGEMVYTGHGDLISLAVEDGTEQWRAKMQATSPPAVDAECLYVTAGMAGIKAIDRKNGSTCWSIEEMSVPIGASPRPVVADGVVLFNGSDLVALDAANGHELWRIDDGNHSRGSTVAVGDGSTLVGRSDDVHAIREEDRE
jgi:outer membrane protein assembly factor BamB